MTPVLQQRSKDAGRVLWALDASGRTVTIGVDHDHHTQKNPASPPGQTHWPAVSVQRVPSNGGLKAKKQATKGSHRLNVNSTRKAPSSCGTAGGREKRKAQRSAGRALTCRKRKKPTASPTVKVNTSNTTPPIGLQERRIPVLCASNTVPWPTGATPKPC